MNKRMSGMQERTEALNTCHISDPLSVNIFTVLCSKTLNKSKELASWCEQRKLSGTL
jgi:hypothetical protein